MLACSLQASHAPQPQEVARAGSLRLLLSVQTLSPTALVRARVMCR